MFDAGALIFKIQTVGAQVFRQEMDSADKAIEKTGKSSSKTASEVDKLGDAQDGTKKSSKDLATEINRLEKQIAEEGTASETTKQKLARLKQEQAELTRKQQEAAAAARELSKVLLIAGAAAGAMVTLAVAKHTEFAEAMSNVGAATMASAEDQKTLGEAALKAGADTAYSASEAAAAEEELAKAGLSVANIVGGSLNGALALAAAGQLQVARSAEIMATTLTQFGLTADKSGHVADVLAAGAGKAQGSVDDLALALTYVGPLAKSAGWNIEETGGTLAYFASQGILGEKAGTSLRGVLAALQAPSRIASKTMDEYGLSVYDANGKMLSASQMAAQLQKAFAGLTDEERNAAMGRIFGNESLTAATLLYNGGAEAISKWTDEVDDSGYAAEQAAMRQDNLAGDIEKLGGALDTALIKTGSGANDVLREMVQVLTAMVDVYGEAPDAVQTTTLVVGVAAAAMLLLAGGAVGARVKFIELKATLASVNASMGRTAVVGGLAGLALTGVIAVVGMLMAAQAEARAKAEAYADTLEEGTNRITRATRDMVKDNLAAKNSFWFLESDSAYDAAKKLGLSLDVVTEAAMGNADALEALKTQMDLGTNGSERQREQLEKTGLGLVDYSNAVTTVTQAITGEAGSLEEAIRVAKQKQDVDKDTGKSSQTAVEAYIAEADSVEKLESNLSDLIDTINKANDANQDAISANIDYEQTLDDVAAQIDNINKGTEGYAKTLDIGTQAGRENKSMLQDLAKDSREAAKKQLELDGNTAGYIERLKEGRQRLIESAIAMGASSEAAEALADDIYNIPPEKEIEFIADMARAKWTIDDFRKNYGTLRGTIEYRAVLPDLNGAASGNGRYGTFADGAVVSFNAGGNVYPSENHVAQMARAGDYRVWAEPETGGESYVPHAPSKRARSEQIMAETAAIFGGTYIPARAQRFADGGVVGGGGIPEVRVIVQPKGGIDLLQYIDVKVERIGNRLNGLFK